MAAILNGFLPLRKKDQLAEDRILNTRWGDSAITAPMHGGWNTFDTPSLKSQESPDLDRDLPPTPPQDFDGQDGVFIIEDDEETDRDDEKSSFATTFHLPWKKRKPASHARKSSYNSVLNPKFAAPKRMDIMAPLGTFEAAAIPLPDSRVSSPVGRMTTTSPVLSFRSRLTSPNLGDILSPVAEGFAKEGPCHRPSPALSPLQYAQSIQDDRPCSTTSIWASANRGHAVNYPVTEGLMGGTMSSQAIVTEQAIDYARPPSRGIASTACMRASSRGPRASSRGSRAHSIEPLTRRAPSVEPVTRRTPSIEPINRRAPSVEPISRCAPSVEPISRRAPSLEPVHRKRDLSVDSYTRTYQPVDESVPVAQDFSDEHTGRRRDPSPVRRRAPSAEPNSRRAPSIGPITGRRAISREPRGRRGVSKEPVRVRFRSEAPYRPRREDPDSSANDASADSESDRDDFSTRESRSNRFEKDFKPSSKRLYRRRSIASPISSPTQATFNVTEVIPNFSKPILANFVDENKSSISAVLHAPARHTPSPAPTPVLSPAPPTAAAQSPAPSKAIAPRTRSISRTRGLYGDMHDDFRLLGRDVHIATAVSTAPERIPSPITHHQQQPFGIAATLGVPSQGLDYSSDTSSLSLPSTQYQPVQGFGNARDHRRDEREKAREKLVRKLERGKELLLSGDESGMSGNESSNTTTTRRVYGGSLDSGYNRVLPSKTMVPDAEEMWG